MLRLSLLICTLFALTACETIQGAGRDIQDVGQTIEREIEG
jgi:predicted small secreted protein